MSTTIDQRVVEMRFDNAQFERNVKTSMSTIDKLKQRLNFNDTSKSLENLSSAAKKVDFSGMTNGIETVNAKFSYMQATIQHQLNNIVDSAVRTGKRITAALTTNPIKDGFKEYETQMNAVQTILANTQKEGTNVETVNNALDKLNTYADKTIYNFTEMTRNIGTFTAAGVKLNDSVSAIQGIANLAAISGSTSQQASTAMYQLSQALASGTVKLMDWNSVVNAGMGGQVFQDALTRTSELLGTGAKAAIDAKGSFRESLSTGWLTTEVLTQTLDQFATAAETQEEYEAAVKKFVEQGYTKEEAKAIADMAKTAGEAATKVKTFTQLLDTLKEALGSGWTSTWRIIIGDFEEAKEVWSGISDVLSKFIGKMSDARNTLLESALGKGFSSLNDKIKKAFGPIEKISESVTEVSTSVNDVVDSITDLGEIVDDVILGKFGNGTERFNKLTEAGHNWCKVQNEVNKKLGNSKRYTDAQIDAQDKLLKTQKKVEVSTEDVSDATTELTSDTKKYLKQLAKMTDANLESEKLTKKQVEALNELKETADKLGIPFDEFIDKLDEINGRWLLINSFKNIGKSLIATFSSIGKAFSEVFDPIKPDTIFDAVAGFHKLTASMIPSTDTCNKLTRTFKGLFAAIDLVTTILGGGFKIAFKVLSAALNTLGLGILDVTAIVGDTVYKFNEWFQDSIIARFVAVITDKIPLAIDSIKNFVSSLNMDDKLANGFKTLCEGIAAAIDIIHGKLSRSLNTNLKIAGSVLSIFGTNMGELAVYLSNVILKYRDWLKTNTMMINGVEKVSNMIAKLCEGIRDIVSTFISLKPVQNIITNFKEAVSDLFSGINFSFDGGLLDGALSSIENMINKIVSWLKSLENSEQFGIDLVLGLAKGITSALGLVVSTVVSLAKTVIDTFCTLLGIHSPSREAMKWGVYIVQGLVDGMKAVFDLVDKGVTALGNKVKSAFESVFKNINVDFSAIFDSVHKVWSGFINLIKSIDFKMVLAIIPVGVTLLLAKKIWDLVDTLTSGIKGINGVLSGFKKVEESFAGVLDSFGSKLKAEAVQKIAISLAILVVALIALTKYCDTDKLVASVTAIVILAGVLAALAFAVNKLDASTVNFKDKSLNISGLKTTILQIGAAMLMVAGAVKLMGSMKENELTQGLGGLLAIIMGISGVMIALGALSKNNALTDVDSIGGTLLKLSISLAILVGVCKLVGLLRPSEIVRGGIFIAGFTAFVLGIGLACRLAGNNINKLGSTVLALSVSLGLMVGVCKLVGLLRPSEIVKGMAFATGFIVFVGALKLISQIFPQAQMQKMSGMILSMTVSLGLMVGVCKLVGLLEPEEMGKGAVFAVAFIKLIQLLVRSTTIGSGTEIAKVSGTILAMSVAIGLMAGVCILLSLLTDDMLKRGIGAVTAFGTIIAVMIRSTKGATEIKGTVMMMAVAIGVMAASVAALSFIKPSKLAGATAALTILMGMFALMTKASKGVGDAMKTILAMSIAIGALAFVLYKLQDLDSTNSIKNVLALSTLVLALSASLRILDGVKGDVGKSLSGVLALTAMFIPLLAFTGILALMSGVKNAESNVKALAGMATVLTLLLIPLTVIGHFAVGALLGVGALTSMVQPMLAFVAVLALMNFIKNAESNAKLLTGLMTTMTDLLVKISLVAPLAVIGVAAMTALAVLTGAIGVMAVAIGGLIDICPDIKKFLDKGLPILEQLAGGMGNMIGAFISNIGSAVSDTLVSIGHSITVFIASIAAASASASTIKASSFDGVAELISLMGEIALMTVGTTLSDIFTFGGTSMDKFKKDATAFFDAMKDIGTKSKEVNIDEETLETVISAAGKLADLQGELESIGGVISWFKGRDDLATFGENIKAFFTSMKDAFSEIIDIKIDEESLDAIVTATGKLADLQGKLEPIGGVISWFKGRDDLSAFGENIKAFFTSMKDTFGDTDTFTIDDDSLTSVINSVERLSTLQGSLEKMGGVISWFTGRKDLGTFGENVATLAEGLGSLKEKIGENGIPEDMITSVTDTCKAIIDIHQSLPKEKLFDGKMSVTKFAGYIMDIGAAIGRFGSLIADVDTTAISISVSAADRIRTLINSLSDLDITGVTAFTGIGTGGLGADGAAYKVAKALVAYSNEVTKVDSTAVSSSITAANRIRSLINSIRGIDTTSISNFKIGPLGASIKNYSDKVSGIDSEAVSRSINIANKLRTFINSLSGTDISGVNSFKSAVTELGRINVNQLVHAFSGSSAKLTTSGINMMSSIAKGMSTKSSALTHVIDNILESIVARIKNTTFDKYGSGISERIGEGITSKKSSITSSVKSALSESVTVIRGYYNKFYNAGSYISSGLALGIKSNVKSAKSAAEELAKAAEKAVRAKLQINSPSKVFRAIGSSIPEGFTQGITMFGSQVKNSVGRMADAAIDSTSNVMGLLYDCINSDIDSDPIIKPVLDLSDIKNGANTINSLLNGNSLLNVQANVDGIASMMGSYNQNGIGDEVISAIKGLRKDLSTLEKPTYNINGITYDDGSNIANAVSDIIRAAMIERRS